MPENYRGGYHDRDNRGKQLETTGQLDSMGNFYTKTRGWKNTCIHVFGEILVARKLCMKEVRFQWEYGYLFSWCKRNSSYGLEKKLYDSVLEF